MAMIIYLFFAISLDLHYTNLAASEFTSQGAIQAWTAPSGSGKIIIKSDANGDKVVNAADIVKLVKDHAPQSDIDAVVKIIMKR